jgi:hypothetical protein
MNDFDTNGVEEVTTEEVTEVVVETSYGEVLDGNLKRCKDCVDKYVAAFASDDDEAFVEANEFYDKPYGPFAVVDKYKGSPLFEFRSALLDSLHNACGKFLLENLYSEGLVHLKTSPEYEACVADLISYTINALTDIKAVYYNRGLINDVQRIKGFYCGVKTDV